MSQRKSMAGRVQSWGRHQVRDCLASIMIPTTTAAYPLLLATPSDIFADLRRPRSIVEARYRLPGKMFDYQMYTTGTTFIKAVLGG